MADSIEQKIIDAIVARMQTILITNGYVTDIGTRVEDSRTDWDAGDPEAGRDSELPAMSVFDGTVNTVEANDNRRKSTRIMPVMIKAFFEKRDDAGDDAAYARNVIKDIHKAIRGTGAQSNSWIDERWPAVAGTPPGLAMDTREQSHGIERDGESFEITGVVVTIEVQYISAKFNLEA